MALYVVSTPIGNLEDITIRAINTLRSVSLIAAEDTRITRRLLDRYEIATPMKSHFEHNELRRAPELIQRLKDGEDVALVTNAGTPGISDPGYPLIRMAIDEGIDVVPVPGATALIPALVASGLPVHSFHYAGFPPRKSGKRRALLESLRELDSTLIFYESPYRVRAFLTDALEVLGDRRAAACRELTKKFEEVIRGRLAELIEQLADEDIRGEFVIVVEGLQNDH